jgi:hypothetical protein
MLHAGMHAAAVDLGWFYDHVVMHALARTRGDIDLTHPTTLHVRSTARA